VPKKIIVLLLQVSLIFINYDYFARSESQRGSRKQFLIKLLQVSLTVFLYSLLYRRYVLASAFFVHKLLDLPVFLLFYFLKKFCCKKLLLWGYKLVDLFWLKCANINSWVFLFPLFLSKFWIKILFF
jgi:hypothetical protein